MPNTEITDPEFGNIKVRRSSLATRLKLKMDQTGRLQISLPTGVPLFLAKRFLNESRDFIRTNLQKIAKPQAILKDGDLIGKTHKLSVVYGQKLSSRIIQTTLVVEIPGGSNVESADIQNFIKQEALKALRLQAKSYLSRRLQTLANEHDFSFTKIRFTNAGTRWGSCSSAGTISLNIWLMQLPFELIDYVLIHELCHTRELNHSKNFWGHVHSILPNYKQLRIKLKQQRPYL